MAAAKYIGAGLTANVQGLYPVNKLERQTYWRRHNLVARHIKLGKGVDMDLMNAVLFDGTIVTPECIALCENIEPITVPLPYPGVPNNFTELAGSANPESKRVVPGCYLIEQGVRSYIGQTVKMGRRVREHSAGGPTTSLGDWLTKAPKDGTVTLYILPIMDSYYGLTQLQMLSVLELYLFLVSGGTTENKSYIPTSGVLLSPEQREQMAEKLSKAVFVYSKVDGVLVFVHKGKSGRALMRDMGLGKSYLSNFYTRTEGWFRSVLLFTKEDLLQGDTPSMTLDELVTFRKELESSIPKPGNPQVIAVNRVTGEIHKFVSLAEMRKVTGRRPSREYKVTVSDTTSIR